MSQVRQSLVKPLPRIVVVGSLILTTLLALLKLSENAWLTLWPSAVALLVVFVARSAFVGLLTGAFAGALLIQEGNPLDAVTGFVV